MRNILLICMFCSLPIAKGGDCLDAVRIVIRSAASMNESWRSACLAASSTDAGKSLCEKTYGIYKAVFKSYEGNGSK